MQSSGGQGPGSNQSNQGGGQRGAANPVEFDHAIHYVTTIKQRFADEPETYKEFLAILHTYQKEQRSIRQVLDQVSHLFRDHPDLLREFTFFLPDAVQDQAKERLNRAAEKAQLRKDALAASKAGKFANRDPYGVVGGPHGYALQAPGHQGRRDDGRDRRGDTSPSTAAMMKRPLHDEQGDDPRGRSKQPKVDMAYKHAHDDRAIKALDRRSEKERERDRNKAVFASKRSKRRPYDTKERRQFLALSDVLIDKEEWSIFEKIKKILPSRDSWREFLKCLELYSQEVLGRGEMLSLVKNLFGRHTDLVDEFDGLLSSHGEQKDPNEMWPFIPLAETDLSQCRRATPSYRALPASFPIPPCSFRSKLEKQVCNDSWVSVPTGSEDFSFKNMRKNQYEEALFKCEDERFEIDMVIDANASTINMLEPLAREIEILKEKDGAEEKLWNYVVDKGTFRVTHLNAISRIYGEAGAQILELLRKYPAGAIPVILKRLKQKDEEWRKARQDLNKQWKEVNEKNYHKSLDHSSFYFKQKDKKQTSMKVLVQEAKKKLETDEKTATTPKTDSKTADGKSSVTASPSHQPPEAAAIADALKKESDATANGGESVKATTTAEWKPHFQYKLAAVPIHKDTYNLLSYAAEKNLSTSEKEKVSKVWQSFFFPFFRVDEEWLVRKPKRTPVSLEKAKMLRAGTEVMTDFGEGTVQSFDDEQNVCVVNLPMGVGYLQPSAMTMRETSDFPASLARLDDENEANQFHERQKSTFFGSQHAYGFLRLYQMLHSRLEKAHELCEKAKRNRHRRMINPAARALDHARATNEDESGKEKMGDYQAYLSKLYGLVDGSIDNTKYEDSCRSLMGSISYFLFTMDKLISLVLKQMQHLATDETCQELLVRGSVYVRLVAME
jgi:paired amphipathic helix protein Sin3a